MAKIPSGQYSTKRIGQNRQNLCNSSIILDLDHLKMVLFFNSLKIENNILYSYRISNIKVLKLKYAKFFERDHNLIKKY